MTNTARWYKGFLLVPVLDDDTGSLDYWDVHENHGEETTDCDPVGWGFSTLAQAKKFVDEDTRLNRLIQIAEGNKR